MILVFICGKIWSDESKNTCQSAAPTTEAAQLNVMPRRNQYRGQVALAMHSRGGGKIDMEIASFIKEYRAKGFVVARGLFGADLLRDVTTEVECVVQDAAAGADNGRMYFDDEAEAAVGRTASAVRCVFRIQEHWDYLRDLLHSALILDLVRPLLGDEPVADGIQYINKPPHASYEFPYHQDNAYVFYHPPRALVATLALDKQRADSGPIACLRGSHVLDILAHQPSGVLGASRGLVDPPDTSTYPEVAVEMEAGDVLVHHANVIHRTGPNRTPRQRRNLGFGYHGSEATKDVKASAKYEVELARNTRSSVTLPGITSGSSVTRDGPASA